MLRGKSNDDVIEAGARSMSMADFKTQIDQEKKQYEQEQNNGQVIPMDELVKAGVAGAMAQELATQQGFAAWMQGIGLRPSDSVVADALKQVPAFFNPGHRRSLRQGTAMTRALASEKGLTEATFADPSDATTSPASTSSTACAPGSARPGSTARSKP